MRPRRTGFVLLLDAPGSGALGVNVSGDRSLQELARVDLPFNPVTLSRRLVPDERPRAKKGSLIETLALTVFLDALDPLPADAGLAATHGVRPRLEAMEEILQGSIQAQAIVALDWAEDRLLPVRLRSMQVHEEAFDGAMKPLRARLELELEVLRSGTLARRVQRRKKDLAKLAVLLRD